MDDKNVVIVAVNNAYVPYLSVLIESIKKNTKKDLNIEIIVLYSSLSEENISILKQCMNGERKKYISFKDVGVYFENKDFFVGGKNNRAYLSKETYFRLVVPYIFSEYSKVLYLDCDIVVQDNWETIFDVDVTDCYVAAVDDIWGNWECYKGNSDLYKYRKKELMLENPVNYFNAGVLLINMEKFRDDYTQDELIELAISKNWKKHDQDLLNYICKGRVRWLDYCWNLIECPSKKAQKTVPEDKYEYYRECYETPRIIHYATRKPWYIFDMMHTNAFWQCAFQSPYKEFLLKQFIQNQMISGTVLENYVFEGINNRKIGVVFIFKCIIIWFKAVIESNR